MELEDLGYSNSQETYRIDNHLDSFKVGRISLEHKERYIIKTAQNEYEGELLGNLRFSANNRYDFPAVGDWVAFSDYDEAKALIHHIYPRSSIIERKSAGKTAEVQIIATNIDFALIVQAVDRDFNLNRLERYLTLCYSSGVQPIIVLSKTDLIDEEKLINLKNQILNRTKDVDILCTSLDTGFNDLKSKIKKGKSYCLLGSSGVGKSTLLNGLSEDYIMKTGEISDSVSKGKHTTSHRELVVLNNGAIMIDNPGMREVGLTDSGEGLELTFDTILEYADDCKYKDCTHTHEIGCAIIEALELGDIDEDSYNNFLKMEREKAHFESTSLDRKKKDKELGKIIREVKKQKKHNKY